MQPHDADVLLPRGLLRLHETRGPVDAHYQASRDLGIESAGMTRLLHPEDALYPADHLVTRGIRGLVEVDHAGGNVILDAAREWTRAARDGRVVRRAYVQVGVILE